MNEPSRHPHPIMIFEYLSRFLLLLIIPLLRGFLYAILGGSLYAWLEGAWFDLLIVGIIITASVLEWFFFRYTIYRKGIVIRRGVLIRDSFFIPSRCYTTLSFEHSWWLRPFRAVHVRVDTAAGNFNTPDFKITLSEAECNRILHFHSQKNKNNSYFNRFYKPKVFYLMLLSLFTSNTFVGVIFCSTLFSNTGSLVGAELQQQIFTTMEKLAQWLAILIPPIATFLAMMIIIGYFISFCMNFLRHINFEVLRAKYSLYISGGFFTRRTNAVDISKINYTDIRQTPMMRLLGLYSVYAHCIGLGKNKNDISAIIPCAGKQELDETMNTLLPEFPRKPVTLRPNFGAIFKFILDPLWPCLLVPIGTIILCNVIPDWADTIGFIGFMLAIPSYWLMLVRLMDFRSSGISYDGQNVYMKYSRFFILHTVCIPKKHINAILLRQSMLQHFDDACDVKIYTISEAQKVHHVKNLNRQQVLDLLEFVKI